MSMSPRSLNRHSIALRFAIAALLSPLSALAQPAQPANPAQSGPASGGKKQATEFPLLKVERIDPALAGQRVADERYEFEFVLPAGFRPLPLDQLAAVRTQLVPPLEQRTLPSGAVQQKEVFVYDDGRGSRILIEAYDPPIKILTPNELRQFFVERSSPGMRLDPSGKVLQFQTRARSGYLVEFDIGTPAGKLHQYVAYLRAGTRSLFVFMTAPADSFATYRSGFEQSLISFAMREPLAVEGESLAPNREFEGRQRWLVIVANLAVLAAVVFAAMRLVRNA
jgi:hypothetical protein